MNFSEIVVPSHWLAGLKHPWLDNGSRTLLITLPGANYTAEKPLFYYLNSLANTEKLDLMHLRYGFQVTGEKVQLAEAIALLKGEVLLPMAQLPMDRYQQVIIVAKSMGTGLVESLITWIRANWPQAEHRLVLLTPLSQTAQATTLCPTLAVYGTSDDLLNEDGRTICHLNAHYCMSIAGADHSLNTGCIEVDLDALKAVYIAIKAFILEAVPLETLNLKQCTEADWPLLASALEAAHPLYTPVMGDAFLKLAQRYRHNGPPKPMDYWCIEVSGEVTGVTSGAFAGFMAFELLSESSAYLIGLYLLPSQRSRGVGRCILKRLEGLLKAQGVKTLVLQAHEAASWAIDFYRAQDYIVWHPEVAPENQVVANHQGSLSALLGNRTLKNTVVMRKEIG